MLLPRKRNTSYPVLGYISLHLRTFIKKTLLPRRRSSMPTFYEISPPPQILTWCESANDRPATRCLRLKNHAFSFLFPDQKNANGCLPTWYTSPKSSRPDLDAPVVTRRPYQIRGDMSLPLSFSCSSGQDLSQLDMHALHGSPPANQTLHSRVWQIGRQD